MRICALHNLADERTTHFKTKTDNFPLKEEKNCREPFFAVLAEVMRKEEKWKKE